MRDRVLHVSDLHFWKVVLNPLALLNKRALGNVNVWLRRRHEFHMERADGYIDALAATGVTTLLLGGDYTSTAHPAEFRLARAFVDRLVARGFQVIAIPGNHDVYTFESTRKRRYESYFGAFAPAGGLPARITLPGGTPLVLAPTVCPNVVSSAGTITPAQTAAVQRLVVDAPEGPLLVMGHYPVLHRTHAYRSTRSRQLRHAEALRAALAARPTPTLYLAGHVHRFSHVQDPAHPQLGHLTTNAFFLQRHDDPQDGAFTEIGVGDAGFEVISHRRVGGGWQKTFEPRLPAGD